MIWALALFLAWGGLDLPPPPPIEGRVDHVLVDKSLRVMVLYQSGWPVRIWPVQLGFAPEGPKQVQGDGRTPEGRFAIDRMNPHSKFHLSLGIDYPRAEHRAAARALGRSPGGDIFIHGQPNAVPFGYRMRGDWTDGCIALTNGRMRELWAAAAIGLTVEIRP